jgi:hypothetical protein
MRQSESVSLKPFPHLPTTSADTSPREEFGNVHGLCPSCTQTNYLYGDIALRLPARTKKSQVCRFGRFRVFPYLVQCVINLFAELERLTCRAVQDEGLQPHACWDCGFESRRGHGRFSLVSVVCCQVEVSTTGRSLVQRSPTDCGVSLCNLERSRMRQPWPALGCFVRGGNMSG